MLRSRSEPASSSPSLAANDELGMCDKIFSIVGKANEKTMPGCTSFSKYGRRGDRVPDSRRGVCAPSLLTLACRVPMPHPGVHPLSQCQTFNIPVAASPPTATTTSTSTTQSIPTTADYVTTSKTATSLTLKCVRVEAIGAEGCETSGSIRRGRE